jgi:two-component system sensor histidine kinase UhpB
MENIMNTQEYRILHLEDSISDSDLIKRSLQKSGLTFQYFFADNEESFRRGIVEIDPNVILCDHALPQFDSVMALEIYRQMKLEIAFILVTGSVSEEYAVEMMKKGIDDYLLKINLQRLPKAIENAFSKREKERLRRLAEEEIIVKNEQLKNLTSHLQHVREEERTTISREIHDELGQQLTALKMDIDWVLHKQSNPDDGIAAKLEEMLKMSDGILNTIRRISSDLRPSILDDLGLIAALEWMCDDFGEKTQIPCLFSSNIRERKFGNNFSITAYRILQETLTNISRHAEAKSVIVSVREKDNELLMDITDDGKGIDTTKIRNGKTLGILGMNERAALLGGKLIITGEEKSGTHIKLTLPLTHEHITC